MNKEKKENCYDKNMKHEFIKCFLLNGEDKAIWVFKEWIPEATLLSWIEHLKLYGGY